MKSSPDGTHQSTVKSKIYRQGWCIGLIICLSAVSESCYHSDTQIPVIIDIKFGYFGLIGGGWTFAKFKDQNQISSSDFVAFTTMDSASKGMVLRLMESGVPCSALGYTSSGTGADLSQLEFLVNLSTSKDFPRDSEIFVTGKNGWVGGTGGGWNPGNDCSTELIYLIPIKMTSHFTANNDTLEVNPLDTVKVNYRSLYTTKSHSAKIAVTP